MCKYIFIGIIVLGAIGEAVKEPLIGALGALFVAVMLLFVIIDSFQINRSNNEFKTLLCVLGLIAIAMLLIIIKEGGLLR